MEQQIGDPAANDDNHDPNHKSPHEWSSAEYVEYWTDRSDREHGARRYRFELMADLIPFDSDADIRILDLGAGFGALSEIVLERFPKARMACLDGSAAMLDVLRERQAQFGDRIETVNVNFENEDWVKRLGADASFDAIVSSQATHGLRGKREGLYRQLYDLVRPGGCFLNVDLVPAATERLQKRYRDILIARHRVRVEEFTGTRPSPAEAEADVDGVPYDRKGDTHRAHWSPGDWTQDLQWLRDAGFSDVDCFWKEMKVVLIGGYRV